MTHSTDGDTADRSPEQFWEGRYRDTERVWSGRPNAALVDAASVLAPGRALDLGCGEGADAIWLARHGWTVTGVDISPTAVARARREADNQQVGAATRFISKDLSTWEPDDGPYDLVTASFLHSPVEVPRTAILRRAATQVTAGGHLLIVSHAAPPPWIDLAEHPGHSFVSPAQDYVELDLDGQQWWVITAETSTRSALAPSGEPAELVDGVLLLQRRRP